MNRFLELRKRRKLRQADLARALGVSRIAVSNWEQGKNLPETSKLIPLSRILRCRVSDLLCDSTSAKPTYKAKANEKE